jgi:hypothetical protein
MRKDRTQRYASAAELAADVRNYPQRAAADGGARVRARIGLRKLVGRHPRRHGGRRRGRAALIIGIITTSWQAHIAPCSAGGRSSTRRGRAAATRRAGDGRVPVRNVPAVDPDVTRGREVTAVELVDRGSRT